jgi:hypothetical protein
MVDDPTGTYLSGYFEGDDEEYSPRIIVRNRYS